VALATVLVFAAPASAVTKDVSIEFFTYSPPSITAAMNVTVSWTNNDEAPHTATSDNPLPNGKPGIQVFQTGRLDLHESAERQLPWAATYPYHCAFHFGMDAQVATRMTIVDASTGAVVRYRVTWARADPRPGVEFDVQVRAPGGTFEHFYRGTGRSRLFTPDVDGSYDFHSRLVKLNGSAVAASTLYSPTASVTVA
jgi:plastocyanin